MKKRIRFFACGKLAGNLIVHFIASLLVVALVAFCIIKFSSLSIIINVIIILAVGLNSFNIVIMSAKKSGYGKAVLKSLILSRVEEGAVSNRFCRITREEIQYVGFEQIYTSHRNNRYFIRGDFGLVVLISKKETKDENFKNYSIRHTICLPWNDKTQKYLHNFVETRNPPLPPGLL